MYPSFDPFAAAFTGVALPQMVIVRNNRVVAISDVPKPKGEIVRTRFTETVLRSEPRPPKFMRRLGK